MKQRSLIIIIVILAVVLVAGLAWCVGLSIGERNSGQQGAIDPQATVTEPTKTTGEHDEFVTESSEAPSFPNVAEDDNAEEEDAENPTNQAPERQETEDPTQETESREPSQETEPEEPTQETEPNETTPADTGKRGENETGRV